jgi:hypothetical protein
MKKVLDWEHHNFGIIKLILVQQESSVDDIFGENWVFKWLECFQEIAY